MASDSIFIIRQPDGKIWRRGNKCAWTTKNGAKLAWQQRLPHDKRKGSWIPYGQLKGWKLEELT